MESEGHWKSSSFNFVFILHVEDVGDITVNVNNLYFEASDYHRWEFFVARRSFRWSSPLLIWYASCVWEGKGFKYLIYSSFPCSPPSLEVFFLFVKTWVFLSYTIFSPFFFGCFILVMIGRFSSFSNGNNPVPVLIQFKREADSFG
jgi:hypothetical protein